MKKITCLLLSFLIFVTPILAQQLQNPCEDTLYLELKNKTLLEMTDREYEYFMQKDKDCTSFLNANPKLDEVKKAEIDYASGKFMQVILICALLYLWLYHPGSPYQDI